MTFYATLDGHQVLTASVTIPRRGAWVADVTLAAAPTTGITGKVNLTFAGLTLVGTVVRGNPFQGSYKARMVGGAAGWRTVIARKFYKSQAGLKRGPILKDAAREAGETITVTDDDTVGLFYVRARGPARDTLDRLYPNWWIDTDGTTKIAARASTNVASAFDLMSYDASLGRYDISTDNPAAFMPGASFVAPTIAQARVNLVTHLLSQADLKTVVYAT